MALGSTRVTTRRDISGEFLTGGMGPDLVFFHGAGGVTADDPFLGLLAEHFTVHAPVWPGFGTDDTEHLLEDMLDFTLHGWDLVDALELDGPPILAGHSMGAMIAAEMASVARHDLSRLVLLAPVGLWDDDEPTPDLFAMLPFEMAEVLFHDPAVGEKYLTGGLDFSDNEALATFMIGRARGMGTAGKILFPIPNRRLSKRIHRIGVPTQLFFGESDQLAPANYVQRWRDSIAGAELTVVAEAGHMLTIEQPEALLQAIVA